MNTVSAMSPPAARCSGGMVASIQSSSANSDGCSAAVAAGDRSGNRGLAMRGLEPANDLDVRHTVAWWVQLGVRAHRTHVPRSVRLDGRC